MYVCAHNEYNAYLSCFCEALQCSYKEEMEKHKIFIYKIFRVINNVISYERRTFIERRRSTLVGNSHDAISNHLAHLLLYLVVDVSEEVGSQILHT